MNEAKSEARMCERALRELDSHLGEEPLQVTSETLQHLRQCSACSQELDLRKRMRDRLKTAARSVSAPPRLEAKIRSGIRETGRKSAWGPYFLPIAAALLVSLGAGIAYQLGHLRMSTGSPESYIASLSGRVAGVMRVGLGDHVHCTVFRKFPKNPPTFEEMTEKLGPEYQGLLPLVKDRAPGDSRIVMAHQCRYHGRKFVHLALRSDSKLLSLVISLKRDGESFTKENLLPVLSESGIPMYQAGVQPFEIAGFETHKHLVFLVSDLPGQKNVDILTALAPVVRDLLNKVQG